MKIMVEVPDGEYCENCVLANYDFCKFYKQICFWDIVNRDSKKCSECSKACRESAEDAK